MASEGLRDPALADLVHQRVLAPRRQVLRDVIADGIASGELRADVEIDTVVPALVGPMLYLGMWSGSAVTHGRHGRVRRRSRAQRPDGSTGPVISALTPASDW